MNHTEGQGMLPTNPANDTGPYPKVACWNVTAGEQNIMCDVQIDPTERQGNMLCRDQ